MEQVLQKLVAIVAIGHGICAVLAAQQAAKTGAAPVWLAAAKVGARQGEVVSSVVWGSITEITEHSKTELVHSGQVATCLPS